MLSPRSFLVTRQNQRSSTNAAQLPSHPHMRAPPSKRNYEQQFHPFSSNTTTINTTTPATNTMTTSKLRSAKSNVVPTPPSSPPKTDTRPPTPTSPVRIPTTPKTRDTAHPQKQHRHHGGRRHHSEARPRDVHSPDAIPASVAALLAVTSIPPPRSRSQRKRRTLSEKSITADSLVEQSRALEQDFSRSMSLGRSPMDMLLSPPDDSDIDNSSYCDSTIGSPLSTRAVSVASMPSLDDIFTPNTVYSVGTPMTTPMSSPRLKRFQPTRKDLKPVVSDGEQEEHPLSSPEVEIDELDFRVFDKSPTQGRETGTRSPLKPLKSAFKSNLTASLRALRQAARSFSSLNFPSIPPEDFLTRSILTIDPKVPYTDERRPPPLQEEPTAALRRYFNPVTDSRLEQSSTTLSPVTGGDFSASIQMQTYKVQRARSASSTGRPSRSSSTLENKVIPVVEAQKTPSFEPSLPGPRQREMRENSDFIRIAVMEMAMRKRGKLDDQRPGRARWALPPRKVSTKPYEIGADGVPARWVAVTY
ncbi:hypothetical protein DL546_006964 [Coniochaeta pulveracea]|uniref:Uncharacterized protein n=1 Tax=Coniochaeta pulveracea TaxID=177199 RepID=A0A420Y8M6_9PEZI|nr:hypothetical protein DL546_006964 [Coniochaeta pulveracea]